MQKTNLKAWGMIKNLRALRNEGKMFHEIAEVRTQYLYILFVSDGE
jgi:hypothetical protein